MSTKVVELDLSEAPTSHQFLPQRAALCWLIFLFSTSLCLAFPGLRYLDDIGDLGIPGNRRTSVQFGRTRAVWADDRVRFEGRDDAGKMWQAILPTAQGLGYTAVWKADFDHNSRPDLLIAAYFPKNGRCVDEITLSFLLFNDRGEPVPWMIQTRAPSFRNPAVFTDLNHNGRAELVVTDCTYSEAPRIGEDRRITGIYEAKDTTWSLIKPARLESYTALVRRSHRFRPKFDQLLATNPADWLDQGNRLVDSPPVQLAEVLTASEICHGVRFPPLVDGRFQADWKDPCEELGRNRIQLSDGTVCYGWPTVMFDGTKGRQIVSGSEHPEPLLRELIAQRRPVVLVGQTEPNRCSPSLLWALRPP